MSDGYKTLHAEFLRGQAQFAYFLLGVAASAVAFAIHETSGRSLSLTPWPYGLGVVLWALSFALGCFGVQNRQDAITSNANFLLALQKIPAAYRDVPDFASMITEAENKVKDAGRKPIQLFSSQQWLFFFGSLAYLAGHILDMYHRNP
jgi:hypothetical protein